MTLSVYRVFQISAKYLTFRLITFEKNFNKVVTSKYKMEVTTTTVNQINHVLFHCEHKLMEGVLPRIGSAISDRIF